MNIEGLVTGSECVPATLMVEEKSDWLEGIGAVRVSVNVHGEKGSVIAQQG